jgi:CheY-like chemotaxis protein
MGKGRILFVDDDPAAQRLYRTYLQSDGYEVVIAASGLEGVEASEAQPFDAVVMDLNMPGLDGWMAMSLIRARRPDVPTVVLTASAGSDFEARARTAGAAAFLVKPCPPESLVRAVANSIEKSRR